MTTTNTYLASKPRYEILDGLRGVAAIIVVLFHIFETYSKGPAYQILNHGYLGVDFFFVLSGFVIGYAYDDRWDRMSLGGFFKRRIIRLHPLVILGCTFGLFMFYFTDSPIFSLISQIPAWKLMMIYVLACLMIPVTPKMDIRGCSETNPLNSPTWSLTYEYVANILYALFIRHFGTKLLAVFVGIFALLTINLTMNIDLFGLWNNRTFEAYTVIGGWSLTPAQIAIGFTRLLYPFFLGLLISRISSMRIKVSGGFWLCALIITIVQVMPRIGGEANPWMNGLYETIAILFVFPLVVSIGAGSEVKGKTSVAMCKFLGDISYPLYIMHYPLIYQQMKWAAEHRGAPQYMHIIVGISVFFLSIGIAYAALKAYDIPVREWLKRKWLLRR